MQGLGVRGYGLGKELVEANIGTLDDSLCREGSMQQPYRGTSPIRKRTPLGPYRGPMPRVLGKS